VVRAVAALGDAQVLIAGDGPDRADLEELATAQAPGRVHFAGRVSEPRDAYAAADVVVLPSRGGDSMPATLIEAGLSGRPVVACPIGAIPEIVVDGHTGRLVPSDDLDALIDALRALLADPAWRDELGRAAREHCAARFSIEHVGRQWGDVLDAVLARRR
jgi:glycosyltransferase involved in cell wall biosynthesis